MVFKNILSVVFHTTNCIVLPITLFNSDDKVSTAGYIMLFNNTFILSTALALKVGAIFYLPIASNYVTCGIIGITGYIK